MWQRQQNRQSSKSRRIRNTSDWWVRTGCVQHRDFVWRPSHQKDPMKVNMNHRKDFETLWDVECIWVYEHVYEGMYGHVTMWKGISSQIMIHLHCFYLGARFMETKPKKKPRWRDGEMEGAPTGSFQSTILVFFFTSPDVDQPSVKIGRN